MELIQMTDKDKRDLAIAATNSFMQNQTTGKNISPSTYADLFLDTFDLFLTKIEERERAKQASFSRNSNAMLTALFDNRSEENDVQNRINRIL